MEEEGEGQAGAEAELPCGMLQGKAHSSGEVG